MTDTPPPPQTTPPQEDGMMETIRTVIFAVFIALIIRTLAFEPFNIPSESMVPTLLIGDFLFVSKFEYGYGSTGTFWGQAPFAGRIGGHEPKRGDVVVFKWPRDNSTDYIKRLIGLPGDTVQMRHGLLYLNGVPVDREKLTSPLTEPGVHVPASATDYMEPLPDGPTHIIRKLSDTGGLNDTEVFTVPPHHYFFMGDNRDNSRDSRDPSGGVGFVPEENLVGHAEIIWFSIDGHFWEFWKWPWAVRWHRLFEKIV